MRGGHAARSQRHLLLPALEAVQARVGCTSGRARLHLPAPDGAAGRGLRRRDLLRAALDEAEAADASRTCATTSPAGWPAPRTWPPRWNAGSGPRARERATGRSAGTARHASAAASRLRQRSSRSQARSPVEAGIASDRRSQRARRTRSDKATSVAGPGRLDPAARGPGAAADRADRPHRSRRTSMGTARTAGSPACAARSRSARGASSRKSSPRSWSDAAAPRSRPVASGRQSRDSRRSPTTSCATPTSRSPARSRTGC